MAKKLSRVKIQSAGPAEELVDFDGWYASRSTMIPKQHSKEVLWADFTSRGTNRTSTMGQFDEALKQYGVKLD